MDRLGEKAETTLDKQLYRKDLYKLFGNTSTVLATGIVTGNRGLALRRQDGSMEACMRETCLNKRGARVQLLKSKSYLGQLCAWQTQSHDIYT